MTIYLSISPDTATLTERTVEVLEALGSQAISKYGRFVVSLAGGSTPRGIYQRWAQGTTLDWSKVALLFGDERCVPPDDERSNYRMVAESLLAGLKTQPQIYRMEGEHADPDQAARFYDGFLAELLGEDGRIHLALLGLGSDGHTASLFPGAEALQEADSRCVSTEAPDRSMRRLTLTVPCLRDAHKLMFLVSGAEKAEVLSKVMEGRLDPELLPAQFFLRDDRLNVNLLMDEPAAAKLKRRQ